MKNESLLIIALFFSFTAFSEFHDSCFVTFYPFNGTNHLIAYKMVVSVDFYSGYELNKKTSSDEHSDNSIIAVIHSDELDNPTVYIEDINIDTKSLTKKQLENGLINSFLTWGYNIMFADDKKQGYWELLLR